MKPEVNKKLISRVHTKSLSFWVADSEIDFLLLNIVFLGERKSRQEAAVWTLVWWSRKIGHLLAQLLGITMELSCRVQQVQGLLASLLRHPSPVALPEDQTRKHWLPSQNSPTSTEEHLPFVHSAWQPTTWPR